MTILEIFLDSADPQVKKLGERSKECKRVKGLVKRLQRLCEDKQLLRKSKESWEEAVLLFKQISDLGWPWRDKAFALVLVKCQRTLKPRY